MITKDTKNIVVADDSEFFRVKLSDILSDMGHNVRVFGSGEEVIGELKANPDWLNLLILDIQMPHIDGFEVLKWIKDNCPKENLTDNKLNNKFPILVITGAYEPSQILEKLKALGASGLMTKAFTPEQITFRINKLLFPDKAAARQETRVPITIPVDFKIGDSASTGFLLNISELGMFLHTQRDMLPGTSVHLRFSLPDSDKVLEIKGIVKWSNHMGQGKSIFSGAGINFAAIKPDEQQLIREFVKKGLERMGLS